MGFGRIGRNVFRLLADDELDVGAIVDIAEPEALAYLLKYDSIYGRFDREVELDGSTLVVDGDRIPTRQRPRAGRGRLGRAWCVHRRAGDREVPHGRLVLPSPGPGRISGHSGVDARGAWRHADTAARYQR